METGTGFWDGSRLVFGTVWVLSELSVVAFCLTDFILNPMNGVVEIIYMGCVNKESCLVMQLHIFPLPEGKETIYKASERITIIFSICISLNVCEIPPTP